MRIAELTARVLESRPGSREFAACSRALAEAAFSQERETAREATRAIFAEIVEPWCDRFEPALCESYVEFMSEVVYAPGSPIATHLEELGYAGPAQLRERYRRVCRNNSRRVENRDGVRVVVLLSRVTLGAEVAVTSPILQGIRSAFRQASIAFIGPRKNHPLLAAGPNHTGCNVLDYKRDATLASRLRVWVRTRANIEQCIRRLQPGQWHVVDPDSRLTQLGLLPVADDAHYSFFESRSYMADTTATIAEIAASWFDDITPEREPLRLAPSPALSTVDRGRGRVLSRSSARHAAAVSFGFGGKPAKRLGGDFEDSVLEMLRLRNFRIALDYGTGEEEEQLVEERLLRFRGEVAPLPEVSSRQELTADLVTWKGSLPGFAGLIASSSLFIGYDSAAAHLAAGLETPVIEVFAGAPCERMRQRWTPCGTDWVRVIAADGPQDAPRVLQELEEELDKFQFQQERERDWAAF